MNKKHALLLILLIVLTGTVQAADLVITIVIPEAKVADFRAGFLAKDPVPLIKDISYVLDPNDPNDFVPFIPQYTEKNWIKRWIISKLFRAYSYGKDKLAKQAATRDPDVVNRE